MGWLAAAIAGAGIAAIVYLLAGAPDFSAPVGTKAYSDESNTFILMLILAVPIGSWVGVQVERRLVARQVRREMMTAVFDGYLARQRARQAAIDASVSGQPWEAEARKRREVGRQRAARLETVWDGLDPYLCLEEASLIRHGFTTMEEVEKVRRQVQAGDVPLRWQNPAMLQDLELLETREAAIVRAGIWAIHRPVF
jgi:hypothetical protein